MELDKEFGYEFFNIMTYSSSFQDSSFFEIVFSLSFS
jgi:hypothetical protein